MSFSSKSMRERGTIKSIQIFCNLLDTKIVVYYSFHVSYGRYQCYYSINASDGMTEIQILGNGLS